MVVPQCRVGCGLVGGGTTAWGCTIQKERIKLVVQGNHMRHCAAALGTKAGLNRTDLFTQSCCSWLHGLGLSQIRRFRVEG